MARYGRVLLTFLMLFAVLLFPVRAEGTPTLRAENASAAPGGEARVEIVMEHNPGIVCLSARVDYDPARLTLTEIVDGGILGESVFSPNKDKRPYQLSWTNDLSPKNFTQNGVLATLVFAVAPDAPPGETPITLSFVPHSALNVELEERSFETVSAVVTVFSVSEEETPPPTEGVPATDAGGSLEATDASTPDNTPPDSTPYSLPTALLPTTAAPANAIEDTAEVNFTPWIVLILLLTVAVIVTVALVRRKKQKHD